MARTFSKGVALAVVIAGSMSAVAGAAVTPLSQYGTLGSAAGQLEAPLDVAIDPNTQDVYVADGNNRRITVFAPDGTFLRAFGKDVVPGPGDGPEVCTTSCQAGTAGTGAGELDEIEGVEVSPAGEVFVADYGAQRISVYDTQGTFRRAFGRDVVPGGGDGFEICTTFCKSGLSGMGPGELNNPWGMAVADDGTLYVTDVSNNRINAYIAGSSEFRFAFGADVTPGGSAGFELCTTSCQTGANSGGPGSLVSPEGLDFDPRGDLWIAEYGGDRVSVVTLGSGQPAFRHAFGKDVIPGGGTGFEVCTTDCKVGAPGEGPGEFRQPQGVAVDAVGTAYVADSANARVQMFDAAPAFLGAFGDDVIPGAPGGFEICTTSCQQGTFASGPGSLSDPYAPADDCRGNVYVTDVGNDRIQRFGEPGAGVGPCEFALGQVKRNKRKGTATVTVQVPGPGAATLAGKGIKPLEIQHPGFIGPETLKVKPKRKTKRKLKRRGKAKVTLNVGYRPGAAGFVAASAQQPLKLKRKRKRSAR